MLLKLNNFGKFKNKSFEISDFITLFYGANESGKTTIFDSLMYLFSENKKSLGFSKMIKNRYGDEIDVESVPAIDDSIKLHPDSYNNLYAIRQSEIIFNMSDNKKDSKEWESEIKKKLFSSDIDIGKMISEIRAEYSGRAQSSIPYQINLMENKKNSIKEELNILYDKINNESSKKEKIKELNDKLNFNANLMREKIKEHDEIFKTFDLKKKAQLKNYKLDLLSLINNFYKKNNFLSENKILQNDYSNEIKSITNNIDELKNKESYLNGKIESLKKNIEERKSIDYNSIKIRIENAIKKIDEVVNKNKKVPKFVFILVVAFISILLSVYFKNAFWLVIILPSLPFLFIKENTNTKIIKDILDTLPELNINNDVNDYNYLRDLLNKELAKIELIINSKDNEEIDKYLEELETVKKSCEEENSKLENLLNKLNAKNIEHYYSMKRDYDALYKETSELYNKLMQEAKKNSLKDISMLEADCNRIIKELETIGYDDFNEAEFRGLENQLKGLEKEIELIKENINKIEKEISYTSGELNNFDNIHNTIVNLESDLSKLDDEIININKRKKALQLLEDILSNINQKNDNVFESLSNEAKVLYNHITGKNLHDDGITMSGFDKNKIIVLDRQNEKRNIEFLSSATRDAVYIAMRLSILTKIHKQGRLILLDDPFITFDNNRILEALKFIVEYSKDYNIPIVIFTKDVFIRDVLKEFEEVNIHELS